MARLCNSIYLPASSVSEAALDDYDLFFIPGNPGLISFYDEFLSIIHREIEGSFSKSHKFSAYGQSLRGFEIAQPNSYTGEDVHITPPPSPVALSAVIEHVESILRMHISRFPRIRTNEE